MGSGFEGLLFLALLAFWIMEAIASARKRKQAEEEGLAAGEEGPPVEVPPPPQRAETRGRERHPVPMTHGDRTPLPQRRSGATPRRHQPVEAVSSEEELTAVRDADRASGMLPADLWEELAALARGEAPEAPRVPRAPPPPVPVPAPRPPRETEASREARARESRKLEGHGLKSRRREPSGAKAPPRVVVGSDEAMAARVRHTPAAVMAAVLEEPSRDRPAGNRAAFQAVFGGTTITDLRRAVLLREVLGPPLSLRERPGPDLS